MREVLTARGRAVLDEFAAAARRENIAGRNRARYGNRRQPDLRSRAQRRPGDDRSSRGQRAILDRAARFDCGKRRAQMPAPVVHLAEEVSRGQAPRAGLRRQRTRVARDARGGGIRQWLRRSAHRHHGARAIPSSASGPWPRRAPTSKITRRKAEFKLLQGHANEEIVKFLKERDADLLFIGAYGHSRIIEMVLGSTTEYVLRNSPCPVFLAR